MTGISDIVAEIEAKEKAMNDKDRAAKAAGTLVGRFIREQIADGYAHYEIIAVNNQLVTVDHLDICDGWSIPFVEHMDREIPLKYVVKNIEFRDKREAYFAKRDKERGS